MKTVKSLNYQYKGHSVVFHSISGKRSPVLVVRPDGSRLGGSFATEAEALDAIDAAEAKA